MKVDVLLGLQWGDEGKGKVVDVLTPRYDVIARFQGGPNAGHTLEFDGIKHVLRTIPSGVFHRDKINIIGNGVVIDPTVFKTEVEALIKMGVNLRSNLRISRKAHLILPTHRLLDAASEASKGESKIGSTLKGIGPAYMDKTGRNGLRVGDIEHPEFIARYETLVARHKVMLRNFNYRYDLSEDEKIWFDGIDMLRSFTLIDSEFEVNRFLSEGKKILAEGAQGSLLDIDFGSYPFVTSSNTIAAGACTGLGVAPNKTGKVFGIFKAYCTRVGSGPFPTELLDETGETLRTKGNEFGAVTKRPRRCGWLDLPALKYAAMINGVTHLIMMKSDVLCGFKKISVCTGYEYKGSRIDYLPFDPVHETIIPVYEELNGWDHIHPSSARDSDLPRELQSYIQFIEDKLSLPIIILSVGPDRSQTLIRTQDF